MQPAQDGAVQAITEAKHAGDITASRLRPDRLLCDTLGPV